MDNIFEVIIGIIVFVVYMLGNLRTKGDDDIGPSTTPINREKSDWDKENEERRRKIQEEIRRKIQQRQAGDSASGPPPIVPQTEREPSRPPPISVPNSEVRPPKQKETSFNWGQSGDTYQQQMSEKLRQIEDTKRRAEALKREADLSRSTKDSTHSVGTSRQRSTFGRGSVRETLRYPSGARAAFIYAEVIGQPISLKRSGNSAPGLNG